MLKEDLRVEPVVQEVIFFSLPPKVERSEHPFFLEEKMWTFSQVCAFYCSAESSALEGM